MKRIFHFSGRKAGRNLFHTKRIKIKRNVPAAIAAGAVFCLAIFLIIRAIPKTEQGDETVIILTPITYTIQEGENLPELKARAAFAKGTDSGDKKRMLSEEAGYSVQDLLVDLNEGKGYEVDCNADGTEAGEFPVIIRLSGEMKSSLDSEWKGKVEIEIQSGTLRVTEKQDMEREKSIDK